MTLAYFRPNPDDPQLCELVVSLDGDVHTIPWPKAKCLDAIQTLLKFIGAR